MQHYKLAPMHIGVNLRRFLRYLLSSPLLLRAQQDVPGGDVLIDVPAQAINLLEFEPLAKKKLPPAHFGYLATGVEDDQTLRANRNGFTRYYLRPRRLV